MVDKGDITRVYDAIDGVKTEIGKTSIQIAELRTEMKTLVTEPDLQLAVMTMRDEYRDGLSAHKESCPVQKASPLGPTLGATGGSAAMVTAIYFIMQYLGVFAK